MSEWLSDLGGFAVQVALLALVVVVTLALVSRLRENGAERTRLRIEELNGRSRRRRRLLQLAASAPGERKGLLKRFRRDDKRQRRQGEESGQRCWVLDFHGDLKASRTARFGEEISALLEVAEPDDEVVIRLESAGGLVHAYGLAAAQLDRLREAGLATRVCVDKVAASGGYLMACCAQHIQAAPFAVLGSIGVVAQVPNVHRLLKRHDVDVEVLTAGRYKRTLTVLGENSEEGREKFVEDLEHTHELFKAFVAERRPALDIEAVATGEIWYGRDALGRGLIDALGTSEAYLQRRQETARVYLVRLESQKRLGERLGMAVSRGVERGIERTLEALDASRWLKR
ncbi:protease [Bisbaumannia pacifica]|uniref:Protease n=1 Tax=Bisbaumannia pacifica TaxID=77098 RepID=A0A510XBY3_9GAMM|nr:protease SohB [Halomonas pacifica]GEK46030.1 protease [Halomonas pacifica]